MESPGFYGPQKLEKRLDSEGLFSHHYEATSSTHYDSLELWTLTPVERWDGATPPQWAPPYTVSIYGGGTTESFTLPLTYGLANYPDPCPGSGRPSSVASRWMVIKVKSLYPTAVGDAPAVPVPFRVEVVRGGLRVLSPIPLRMVDPAGRMLGRVMPGEETVLRHRGTVILLGKGIRRKVVIP